ncbi:MAG: hypothetical protein K0S71_2505 [Clostridia bacterium]|jgi:putative Ca2+/H+ antiporter (TMEM165/GDT1 family)|nr:hypothetical protein [Clostridia bacterium]
MTKELLGAFLLVFVAEMGDKTQIIAMMFATRYKATSVLAGVLIGSLLNHGLAVLLGATLGNVIPVPVLATTAGLAFIYFAFSSLKHEVDGGENMRGYKNAVTTVASAFFIGELGDKTQLSAITLSMDAVYPWFILMGTVSAMVVSSSLGIWIGSKIGQRISETLVKVVSATLFFSFGSIKLVTVFLNKVDIIFIIMEVIVISGAFIWAITRFIQNNKERSL